MQDTADTYRLLRAFVDELARCGLAGACTSPGSRSTPLVLTLARERRVPTWSHVDERCAAFFALGVAKATGRPVALACTSGTAAANYAPAVIEAAEARVPLIVLTADRPPELRANGAGQTIDQIKLYGDAAKWFVEVGTHAATPERIAWMRQLACRAFAAATEGPAGPVHLNFPLREPLVFDGDLPDEDPAEPRAAGRADGRPWIARPHVGPDAQAAADLLTPIVASAERGVIVAGRDEGHPPLGIAVARLGAAIGWPVLAEPLSGARRGPAAIAHYDALLRSPAFAGLVEPDVVLRAGDLPTSKPLRQWLAGRDAVQVLLDPDAAWQDPTAVADLSLPASARAIDLVAAAAQPVEMETAWLAGWRRADELAAAAIEEALSHDAPLTEPRVAAELGGRLPADATLVVSASMPVRDVETFTAVRDDPPRVLANRGANGIDGTISTAFGVAAGSAGPVVLLIGDVALAHDIGGLLAAHRLRLPLTIVLIDNGGGGIFDFLPVSSQRDVYEEHVATPTGLDPEQVARTFGLRYSAPSDLAEFRQAVDAGLACDDATIVHVITDRGRNVALHRRIWQAVDRAVSQPR